MSARGKYTLSPQVQDKAQAIVTQLNYLSNVCVFCLAGMMVVDKLFNQSDIIGDWRNWALLVTLYIFLVG
jgi:hypothetical protein